MQTCNRLGVVPPSEEEFLGVYPTPVTNPTSGVIVLPEILIVSAETGAPIECDVPATCDEEHTAWPDSFLEKEAVDSAHAGHEAVKLAYTEGSQKKSRKKKDES